MTCPTCELLASDTSHLEAVQQWECEKAELVDALRRMVAFGEEVERKHLVGDEGCFWPVEIARDVIRKYEAPQ